MTVKVMFDYQLSVYHAIAYSITLPPFGHHSAFLGSTAPLHRHDKSKIDQTLFIMSVDSILDKLSIPFCHLFRLPHKKNFETQSV